MSKRIACEFSRDLNAKLWVVKNENEITSFCIRVQEDLSDDLENVLYIIRDSINDIFTSRVSACKPTPSKQLSI